MPGQTEDTGGCRGDCPAKDDEKLQEGESITKDDKSTTGPDVLDFSSCKLSTFSLPQKDYLATTVLNLDYNDLTSLPNDIVTSVPHLEKLSVIGNDLEEFPETIGRLSKLQEILASENMVTCLPGSFKDLKQLQRLDLVGNKLTELILEIGCLEKLQRLDIEENALQSLPDSFGSLQSLEVFEASGNELKILPDNFGQLKKLRILNLSNNDLINLPDSFGNLPNLRWVDLSSNYIEKLPDNLNSAETVERLYLIGNEVKSIPNWISNMPNITELSFRDNQLVDKPFTEQFGSVSIHLKSFDISGNFIKSLPNSLGNLKQLETLHMGSVIGELERRNFQNGNWIPHLPDSFGNLQNLRELRADENQLSELPENFGQLGCLEFLDLGQNMLQKLPTSFTQLVSLKVCKLSKNHLHSLPEDIGNLKNLEDLRLDSNQIPVLPKSVENLKELTTLDLFDNRLKAIPECLEKLKKISRLDLDENDFDLPYYNVPHLTQNNKYPTRNPQKSNNWRGKVRVDNIMRDDFPKFVNNTDPSSTTVVSKTLLQAMQNSRSIWEAHEGSTVTRQRPTVATGRTQTNGLNTADENTTAECSRLSELTEKLDLTSIDGEEENNDENSEVGRRNRSQCQFHYTSSEETESECASDLCSDISIDGRPRGSSDGRSSSPVPVDPLSDVSPEDWDAELEASPPYDMTQVYQHPADDTKFVFDPAPNFDYIPADEHVQSISTNNVDFQTEDGQFDDA